MLRRSALAALLVLAVGCGGGSSDGNGRLIDAHAALCRAAVNQGEARALFFDRAHDALHEVARRVEDVDRGQAARLLESKERVESDLNAGRPPLPDDLLNLAEVYRASLGRLAITAPPCDK